MTAPSTTGSNGPTSDLGLPGQVCSAVSQTATIVEHEPMARNTWRMRLACPDVARQIVPGQFFMIRLPHASDPLLGRPFALFDTWGDPAAPEGIDFGYLVVGKQTTRLARLKVGDTVEIWGPLGNGFPVQSGGHVVFVAGGIGQTPFLAAAKEALGLQRYGQPGRQWPVAPQQVSMCYGVRSRDYLAGLEAFRLPGLNFQIATDDGSAGHHGYVTQLLQQLIDGSPLRPTAVYCCGPEPMMHAVQRLTAAANVPCWLSLETPMACGFGACFSCVTRIRQADGEWDYKRVCVEGPVFPADKVVFA